LITLGVVLGYAAFQWGGVRRSDQYEYLLALGVLAMLLNIGRQREERAVLPECAVRWATVLLPAYILLQVIPFPMAELRLLSPLRAAAVDALKPIGAKLHFASLSVSPTATFQSFLLVCGYVIVFLLVRELMARFEDHRWLAIWPIVIIGALEAGLGLWQHLGGTREQVRCGTYANCDHYAGFLEMALPFAVMYPVTLLRRTRSRRGSPVSLSLAVCGVWALAGVTFVGIIYSLSRMGFIAALCSLFVVGTLAFGSRPLIWVVKSRKRQITAVVLAAALVVAGFVFLPPDKLILRFAQITSVDGLTAEGRIKLWAETAPLIKAYSVFGCGLGGYATAFSKFKISEPLLTDDFVHNDYLQLLAELGLVGFLIVAVLAVSVVGATLKKAAMSPNQGERHLAVACTGALAAILLHSLVDFNLYIPANAMLLAWIAGMAVGGSWSSSLRDWRPHEELNVIAEEVVRI
jgi:O-antigen ligase